MLCAFQFFCKKMAVLFLQKRQAERAHTKLLARLAIVNDGTESATNRILILSISYMLISMLAMWSFSPP
jgi:hypothetical protein